MTGKKSDKSWMTRHLRDTYVKRAAALGYRSRAAFKLIELAERDRLLRPGMLVLDLGAAPGGWSQVAAKAVGSAGQVVAIDLLAMQPIAGVEIVQADLRAREIVPAIAELFAGRPIDLVISDMAPNLSGIAAADEARAQELVEIAVRVSGALLKPDGCLLVKLFHGSGLAAVIQTMRGRFEQVVMRKPAASRSRSSEVYAVCKRPIRR
jgi:23S rRNA (uridine2552-2'-O)-methyltransferase